MQNTFSNALSKAVSQHIELSPTRHQTLAWLAWLIMQHGTIWLWRLAAHRARPAENDSVGRRVLPVFEDSGWGGAKPAPGGGCQPGVQWGRHEGTSFGGRWRP